MALDKVSAQPLYLQLEELIRNAIDSGQLQSGDRVPGEVELATTHGISRMTARRAIDALVMEGILFRQPGKGTFVAKAKLPVHASTLFSFSNTVRAAGLTTTSRVLELRRMPPPPKVAAELQLTARQEVIFSKRLRYVEGQPTVIHTSYMPADYFAAILDEDLTDRPLTQIMEQVSGLRIVASRDYVEAAMARPDEAELLEISQGAPVLLVRGVTYTREGMPARSSSGVYRGDRCRFFVSARDSVMFEVRAQSQHAAVASLVD
jgi:GntR family transcriptional regulator